MERKLTTEFNNAIDTIEIDPRPGLKAAVARTVDRMLDGVPVDLAERIATPRLKSLIAHAREAIECGHADRLNGIVATFAGDLREAILFERQSGELKPHAPADEIKKFGGAWSDHRWNGFETDTVLQVLEQDERILHVGLREIKTDRRTITRSEMKAFAQSRRPKWARDDEYFARNFTSESAIKEAAERARENERSGSTYSSGPREIIGKPIGSVN